MLVLKGLVVSLLVAVAAGAHSYTSHPDSKWLDYTINVACKNGGKLLPGALVYLWKMDGATYDAYNNDEFGAFKIVSNQPDGSANVKIFQKPERDNMFAAEDNEYFFKFVDVCATGELYHGDIFKDKYLL